ncbi:MAG: 5'-methylthioadenosine/S-adenosylhomocysteine nucleosidase family protein [Acidimicrobiales bacterium]
MRSELRPILRGMAARRGELAGLVVHTATMGRSVVTAAMIGVGPSAAARTTEQLLMAGTFDHVVISGIAGGIDPSIAVGTLITPAAVEDLGSGRRFRPAPLGGHQPEGTIGTTHELILDEKRLAGLVERGIVALDMETAAVAAACESTGCPWSVFRVVSDRPQDGLLDDAVMGMLRSDGTVEVRRAAQYVLTHPSKVGPLARLARDAAAAASLAAKSALAGCVAL